MVFVIRKESVCSEHWERESGRKKGQKLKRNDINILPRADPPMIKKPHSPTQEHETSWNGRKRVALHLFVCFWAEDGIVRARAHACTHTHTRAAIIISRR